MKGELFAGAKMLLGRKQLLCIGAGLVFGAAAQAGQEINRSPDRLVRPDYGEEETHQILVEGKPFIFTKRFWRSFRTRFWGRMPL